MNTTNPLMLASLAALGLILASACSTAAAQQPKVNPNPNESGWPDLLRQQWGLDLDRDLRNPMTPGVVPPGLFHAADPNKPVKFRPLIALGLETTTRGGWYAAGPSAADLPADVAKAKRELWSYKHKQNQAEMQTGVFAAPPVVGETEFKPGPQPFGLWIGNDEFPDGGVFTQPALVAKVNERLRAQPYKAMIYPCRDRKTGKMVPDSYVIGWEYSTNDDFQDTITLIENARLVPADPALRGVLSPGAQVKKLAGDFKFTEGPAWDSRNNCLYFSDIPPAHIVRFADGKATVANAESRQANGLMLDKQGMLIACEHGGRRISRAVPGQPAADVVTQYKGKRLNSPNDLWIDAAGGIYFTDPRYGSRDDLEQDKEAVYYVTSDGSITRIINDLVRPNGIALSPDGKHLYVVDNGADELFRYPVTGPGRIGKGQLLAHVAHPDGMSVDIEGRLYITCHGGVWVLDDNGKWLGLIETPEQPANCTFGGAGCRTLFITARTSLYAVETLTRGWHVHLDGPPPGR